jgi:Predicted membrane protein
MNRTFHTRISWYQYAYLILIGLLAFWMLWIKAIIPAVLCMILVVFLIERFIHTTYTITDNRLIIYLGRFAKTKAICLKDIHSVERRQSHFGRLTNTSFILIQYKLNKYTSVMPMNERDFIDLLDKRRYEIHNPINT